MATSLTMQIHPGRGLGFIALGAPLHEVLSRLKSQPNRYPTIDIFYSPTEPLIAPVILNLPKNGFRLRFDGPDQRLRLIEVLEFSRTHFTYNNKDVVKLSEQGGTARGPTFRHIYDKLIGPTFPGEYMPPTPEEGSQSGSYVLSYPGVAFTFPVQDMAWTQNNDFVSLLSSPSAAPARSMAIYEGASWQEARRNLYSRPFPSARPLILNRGKESRPHEVDYVVVRGNGELDIMRKNSQPFQVVLSKSTPQDLVAELGPPDAIYRKSDRRLSIHKTQRNQQNLLPLGYDDSTDTDQASSQAATDESDAYDGRETPNDLYTDIATECFYNYFHHGFDIFISYPTHMSRPLSGTHANDAKQRGYTEGDQLVATKILLHGNIPGSYPFNRHRRCRWVIDAENIGLGTLNLSSETPFSTLSESLQQTLDGGLPDHGQINAFKQGMVLNRGWGNSPGSSCELLGGWEESDKPQTAKKEKVTGDDGPGLGNTELFGLPGMVFEVLKNDAVSCLTIY